MWQCIVLTFIGTTAFWVFVIIAFVMLGASSLGITSKKKGGKER